jgi:hypothetical protein
VGDLKLLRLPVAVPGLIGCEASLRERRCQHLLASWSIAPRVGETKLAHGFRKVVHSASQSSQRLVCTRPAALHTPASGDSRRSWRLVSRKLGTERCPGTSGLSLPACLKACAALRAAAGSEGLGRQTFCVLASLRHQGRPGNDPTLCSRRAVLSLVRFSLPGAWTKRLVTCAGKWWGDHSGRQHRDSTDPAL